MGYVSARVVRALVLPFLDHVCIALDFVSCFVFSGPGRCTYVSLCVRVQGLGAAKVRQTFPRLRAGPGKVCPRTIRNRISDSGGTWKQKSLQADIAPKSVKDSPHIRQCRTDFHRTDLFGAVGVCK